MGSKTSSIIITHPKCHLHIITTQHTSNCIITISNHQSN